MPISRAHPDSPDAPASAGQWRSSLRRDAGDHARWQRLAATAHAVAGAADTPRALDAVLQSALSLLAAHDAAVLALRGERWQVLASQGRALPPGASLPGAWPGLPAEVVAARATRPPDWWLGPAADARLVEAAVPGPAGAVGLLSVATARADIGQDDRDALHVLAAMLGAYVGEPAPTPRRRRGNDPRLAALTRRERQVLALLPRGLTNAALASELGIAPGTVKVHVERILHKLQVRDRTEAAVYATRHGAAA